MVRTRTVSDRRALSFSSMDDIRRDVEALDAAGQRSAAGNWTPAQIVDHITRMIEFSLDGFTFTMPWPIRAFGRLVRGVALRRPMKPGLKLPVRAGALEPDPHTTWDAAVRRFRTACDRIAGGETMTEPSPVLGAMSHDDWVKLHCRHAEMHLSFVHPERDKPQDSSRSS